MMSTLKNIVVAQQLLALANNLVEASPPGLPKRDAFIDVVFFKDWLDAGTRRYERALNSLDAGDYGIAKTHLLAVTNLTKDYIDYIKRLMNKPLVTNPEEYSQWSSRKRNPGSSPMPEYQLFKSKEERNVALDGLLRQYENLFKITRFELDMLKNGTPVV